MEKQEIRTFGRRHGKKLSARQSFLCANLLPTLVPHDAPAARTILEIGFGAGEHVRELARENADAIIIGAEPFMNGVASLLSAITDDVTNAILPEYKNIRIFPDDVRIFLSHHNILFDEIWILHPDPWPKARHEKRRLLSAAFLRTLSDHLTPHGQIIIGTDHWEYFDWIVAQIPHTGLIPMTSDTPAPIHTRYQIKNKAGTAAPKYLILKNKSV